MAGLLERIRQAALELPDRTAHDGGGASMTYRELWGRANALAAELEKRGVTAGSLVGVREVPGVVDAVVLPLERRGVIDSLAAFVVTRKPVGENTFAAAQSLREALAARIPEYMIPRRVEFLESFPLTANGKTDRKSLAARLP